MLVAKLDAQQSTVFFTTDMHTWISYMVIKDNNFYQKKTK